jgi:hypothetical protein
MQGARRDAYETTSAGVAKTAANEPFQADWMFDGPSPDARRGGFWRQSARPEHEAPWDGTLNIAELREASVLYFVKLFSKNY